MGTAPTAAPEATIGAEAAEHAQTTVIADGAESAKMFWYGKRSKQHDVYKNYFLRSLRPLRSLR